MACKNAAPAITHVEILCLAFRAIDAEIEVWRERCENLPHGTFYKSVAPLLKKRQALKSMYYVETGTDYDG